MTSSLTTNNKSDNIMVQSMDPTILTNNHRNSLNSLHDITVSRSSQANQLNNSGMIFMLTKTKQTNVFKF